MLPYYITLAGKDEGQLHLTWPAGRNAVHHPHMANARRKSRKNGFCFIRFGTLEIEITVDDPKAYTKPWTVKLTQLLKADTDLLDYYCVENEKDGPHLVDK